MRRRLAVLSAVLVVTLFAATPGFAAGHGSPADKKAGEQSQEVADGADWFMSQRLAPNGAVNPNAYAAGAAVPALSLRRVTLGQIHRRICRPDRAIAPPHQTLPASHCAD